VRSAGDAETADDDKHVSAAAVAAGATRRGCGMRLAERPRRSVAEAQKHVAVLAVARNDTQTTLAAIPTMTSSAGTLIQAAIPARRRRSFLHPAALADELLPVVRGH